MRTANGVFVGKPSAKLARAVRALVADKGEYVNGGCFQGVYKLKGIKGVIKIAHNDYLAVKWAVKVAGKNPHTPKPIKFYGQFRDNGQDIFVYQVEELLPVDEVAEPIWSLSQSVAYTRRDNYDEYANTLANTAIEMLGDEGKRIAAAIFDVKRFLLKHKHANANIDLHSENWMIRPGTGELVVNDPISHSGNGRV